MKGKNTFGQRIGSPMAACSNHAELGGREGRVQSGASAFPWKQRGKTPLEQVIVDGGAEANRLWELKHGNRVK